MTQQKLTAPWPFYWSDRGWTQTRKIAHRFANVEDARKCAAEVLGRVCRAGDQILVYKPEGK